MRVIIDSSALLAGLLGEKGSDVVADILDHAVISTVNLAEVTASLAKDGNSQKKVRSIIETLKMTSISPDEDIAMRAGFLRSQTDKCGLSLGDRFCLALAQKLDATVYTADKVWADVADDLKLEIRQIR